MITLHVRPQDPPVPDQATYERTAQPFSVGIDGFVGTGTWYNLDIPMMCLNHHEGCDRTVTLATCQQALRVVRLNVMKAFEDAYGNPTMHVDANDCDHDVCASWWVLKNHERCKAALNQHVNALIAITGDLDATAGAYPIPRTIEMMRKIDWVYDPYMQFRISGQIDKRDPSAFRGIIDSVCLRIDAFVNGRAEMLDTMDRRYEDVRVEKGWRMIKELGTGARGSVFADGIEAFLSIRERLDGAHSVSICKSSPFVRHFNVPRILNALNEEEGLTDKPDRWGGSDLVGGSPRVSGTRLSLDTQVKIINRCVETERDDMQRRRARYAERRTVALA